MFPTVLDIIENIYGGKGPGEEEGERRRRRKRNGRDSHQCQLCSIALSLNRINIWNLDKLNPCPESQFHPSIIQVVKKCCEVLYQQNTIENVIMEWR